MQLMNSEDEAEYNSDCKRALQKRKSKIGSFDSLISNPLMDAELGVLNY